jgi:pimeloyl-ACP methyl ester carboxylesterase
LENLDTDAESVKDFLATVSGPIVLVGHSYGGSVITNAAAGNPNVKALVYVDAAAPDVGETTASLSGAGSVLTRPQGELFDPVPSPGAPDGAAELYLKKDIFLQHVGNDLPPDLAARAWPASEQPRRPHCSHRRRARHGSRSQRRLTPDTGLTSRSRHTRDRIRNRIRALNRRWCTRPTRH